MHHLHRDILLVAAALLVVACSSDSTLEEKREHAPLVDDQKPMVFSSSSAKTAATRASSALETLHDNFKVSVWKNYGNTASQQNVMDGYRVNYAASEWDSPTSSEPLRLISQGHYWQQTRSPSMSLRSRSRHRLSSTMPIMRQMW